MNDMRVFEYDEALYIFDKFSFTRFNDFVHERIKDICPEFECYTDLDIKEMNLIINEVRKNIIHDYITGYSDEDFKWDMALVEYTPTLEDAMKRFNAKKSKKDEHNKGWCECFEELKDLLNK